MGKLIVIEGLDGSGKSTQTPILEAELKNQGREVLTVSFPNYESDSRRLSACIFREHSGHVRRM